MARCALSVACWQMDGWIAADSVRWCYGACRHYITPIDRSAAAAAASKGFWCCWLL